MTVQSGDCCRRRRSLTSTSMLIQQRLSGHVENQRNRMAGNHRMQRRTGGEFLVCLQVFRPSPLMRTVIQMTVSPPLIVEGYSMKSTTWSTPINYRVLFIVFTLCSGLGVAGLIASELLMPQNAGGLTGRLTMYRYMGTATFCWASIAMWSWYQLRLESIRHK